MADDASAADGRTICPTNFEDLRSRPATVSGLAIGLAGVLLLIGTSVQGVPPLKYGIRYNTFNKYTDVEKVYKPGRHILGPWNKFLLFPSHVCSVEFTSEARLDQAGRRFPALHTRTKEGLALHLQVSLQYSLQEKYVGKLFSEFSMEYETFFIGVIRDTLINVAAEYTAFDLWERRQEVGYNMQQNVDKILRKTYASCWGLQLMVIELPPEFDMSIISTQVVMQNYSTMMFQQSAFQVRAETEAIRAEFDKQIKVIIASGRANYTLNTKLAKASARNQTLQTEAAVLHEIKARLKLEDDHLLEYQQYASVSLQPNATVFFGFEEDSGVIVQQKPRRAASIGDQTPDVAPSGVSDAGAVLAPTPPSPPPPPPPKGGGGEEL